MKLVGQGGESFSPSGSNGRRNAVGKLSSRSAGANGIRKDVELRRAGLRNKGYRLRKTPLRFAGKTNNHIDTEKCVGHFLADAGEALGESRGSVTAAHKAEDVVGATLERNVEVRLEFIGRGAEVDDAVGEKVRLDRRDTVTRDVGNRVKSPEKVDEALPGGTPEVPGINPGKDDLLDTLRSDNVGLRDQVGDGGVTRRPASRVDSAIRATIVATILNLKKRTSALALAPSGRKAREVAKEELGNAGKSGNSLGIAASPTTGDDDTGLGVGAVEAGNQVTAFLIGSSSNGASVDDVSLLGHLVGPGRSDHRTGKSGRLGKVDLTTKGVERNFHARKITKNFCIFVG